MTILRDLLRAESFFVPQLLQILTSLIKAMNTNLTFAQRSPQVAGSCQTIVPGESGKPARAMNRADSCLS